MPPRLLFYVGFNRGNLPYGVFCTIVTRCNFYGMIESPLLIPSEFKSKQNPMSRFTFENFDFNTHSYSLPGIRALAKGVVAMEEGEHDAAIAWFEFVLAENPQASEARLLLAESLIQQDRLQEASASHAVRNPGG